MDKKLLIVFQTLVMKIYIPQFLVRSGVFTQPQIIRLCFAIEKYILHNQVWKNSEDLKIPLLHFPVCRSCRKLCLIFLCGLLCYRSLIPWSSQLIFFCSLKTCFHEHNNSFLPLVIFFRSSIVTKRWWKNGNKPEFPVIHRCWWIGLLCIRSGVHLETLPKKTVPYYERQKMYGEHCL